MGFARREGNAFGPFRLLTYGWCWWWYPLQILKDYYPERMNSIYLVNSDWIFKAFWRVRESKGEKGTKIVVMVVEGGTACICSSKTTLTWGMGPSSLLLLLLLASLCRSLPPYWIRGCKPNSSFWVLRRICWIILIWMACPKSTGRSSSLRLRRQLTELW